MSDLSCDPQLPSSAASSTALSGALTSRRCDSSGRPGSTQGPEGSTADPPAPPVPVAGPAAAAAGAVCHLHFSPSSRRCSFLAPTRGTCSTLALVRARRCRPAGSWAVMRISLGWGAASCPWAEGPRRRPPMTVLLPTMPVSCRASSCCDRTIKRHNQLHA